MIEFIEKFNAYQRNHVTVLNIAASGCGFLSIVSGKTIEFGDQLIFAREDNVTSRFFTLK